MRHNRKRATQATLATHLSFNQTPADDLAFELRLLEARAARATLFIYGWSISTLVIGKGQATSEIRHQNCVSEGVTVLRRQTGGTSVLHNRTLNIGLVLPAASDWTKNVIGLYTHFISVVSTALKRQGITVTLVSPGSRSCPTRTAICFESRTDDSLLLGGKKVFGCAQRRLRESILVHGTLLLAVDIPQQSRVFGVPEERIETAMTAVPEDMDQRDLTTDIIGVAAAALGLAPEIASEREG